ncbi:unnamed protein product, partial [Ectocarpus sp. 12 AP-2014]
VLGGYGLREKYERSGELAEGKNNNVCMKTKRLNSHRLWPARPADHTIGVHSKANGTTVPARDRERRNTIERSELSAGRLREFSGVSNELMRWPCCQAGRSLRFLRGTWLPFRFLETIPVVIPRSTFEVSAPLFAGRLSSQDVQEDTIPTPTPIAPKNRTTAKSQSPAAIMHVLEMLQLEAMAGDAKCKRPVIVKEDSRGRAQARRAMIAKTTVFTIAHAMPCLRYEDRRFATKPGANIVNRIDEIIPPPTFLAHLNPLV